MVSFSKLFLIGMLPFYIKKMRILKKKKSLVHVLIRSMVKAKCWNHAYLAPEFVLCSLYRKTLTYWQFDNILNITMAFSCYLQRRKFRFLLLVYIPYGFIKIMNVLIEKFLKTILIYWVKTKRWIFIEILHLWGFPGRVSGKESTLSMQET